MVSIEISDEDDEDSLRTDRSLSLLSPPDDYESDIALDDLEDAVEE